MCSLRIRSPKGSTSWSGWHGAWMFDGHILTASFHWRGRWSKHLVTYKFHPIDTVGRRPFDFQSGLMWFEKDWKLHFVKKNGVVVDRLAARCWRQSRQGCFWRWATAPSFEPFPEHQPAGSACLHRMYQLPDS